MFPTILRWLGWLALAVYFALAGAILVLRYGILPNIDTWRPAIEQQISQALGGPVSLTRLQANWKGLNPSLDITGLRIHDNNNDLVLNLPRVRAQLNWLPLVRGQIQFSTLQAQGLELDLRRDAQNRFWMLGHEINVTDANSSDPSLPPVLQWLLGQKSLVLEKATVRWTDELRNAPALLLENVFIQFEGDGKEFRARVQAGADKLVHSAQLLATLRFEHSLEFAPVPGRTDVLPPWTLQMFLDIRNADPGAWAAWVDVPQNLLVTNVSTRTWVQAQTDQAPLVTLDANVENASWQGAGRALIGVGGMRIYGQGAIALARNGEHADEATSLAFDVHVQNAAVDMPAVFSGPLAFDDIQVGATLLHARGAPQQVSLHKARIVNTDMDVSFAGLWRADPAYARGEIEAQGQFARASLNAIHRYLPLEVDADARDWMSTGLIQGQLRDAGFILRGDLAAFPFGDAPGKGYFYVGGPFDDAIIDYVPSGPGSQGWPRLEGLNGLASLTGVELRVQADTGRITPGGGPAITLDRVVARIPNIEENATLSIEGESSGSATAYLALNSHSPLGGLLDNALDAARADGSWRVPLWLKVPLYDTDATTVTGSIIFDGGTFQLDSLMPVVSGVNGQLDFSDSGIRSRNIKATALGGGLTISGGLGDDNKNLLIAGQADSQAISRFAGLGTELGLEGRTAYRVIVERTPAGRYDIDLTSDLKGMRIDLPSPLGKFANEVSAFEAQWQPLGQGRAQLQVRVGDGIRMDMRRNPAVKGPYFNRGAVALNQPLVLPDAGMNIDVRYPALDLDAWLALMDSSSSDTGDAPGLLPPLNQIRIQSDRLRMQDVDLDKATLTMAPLRQPDGWRVDISSSQTAGTLLWRASALNRPASLEGKFARLTLGNPDAPEVQAEIKAPSESRFEDFKIPSLNLTVDDLVVYGQNIGGVALDGSATGAGRILNIDQLE
ncbi:MAG: AsmA family protein, partial [Pusillimonas sp.]|nr:AsmA family protein [Pusillimonas sp.]